MDGAIYILGVPNTFSFTIPNAWQKMKKFRDGDWELVMPLIIRNFPNGNGGFCAEQRAYVHFKYFNLADLYCTKQLHVSKITWLSGATTNYPGLPVLNSSQYSMLNYVPFNSFVDNIVWEILGRMCHLLQDMGVPAHANVDPHGGLGLVYDSFESAYGDIGWTADMVYAQNSTLLNPFESSDPLHFLMYTTQQQANHFISNGPHMAGYNDIFDGDGTAEEIAYLISLGVSNYGASTVENMNQKLFPQIIRATASLLYWFAVEARLITPVRINNSFLSGTLLLDSQPITSGLFHDFMEGEQHVISSVPQQSGNNSYIWNNYAPQNRSSWKKFNQFGNIQEISNNLQPVYNLNPNYALEKETGKEKALDFCQRPINHSRLFNVSAILRIT